MNIAALHRAAPAPSFELAESLIRQTPRADPVGGRVLLPGHILGIMNGSRIGGNFGYGPRIPFRGTNEMSTDQPQPAVGGP